MSSAADQPTGQGTGQAAGQTAAPTDPDAIREEIERTREDLAGTVDALHAKLDVKGRAKARASEVGQEAKSLVAGAGNDAKVQALKVKDLSTTDQGKPRPELLVGVAAFVVAAAALVWWRRR